ncbi:MAG: hypothetical protein ACYDH0_08395 [Candidatus Aminicenantales bacterium]
MTEEKKKGILSKLFGTNKPPCCGVRIEEINEEENKEAEKTKVEEKSPAPRRPSCCD